MTAKPKLIYRPPFVNDMTGVFDWIRSRDEDAAIRFAAAVRDSSQQLIDFPADGPTLAPNLPVPLDVRKWPLAGFGNYMIVYRRRSDAVELLRLLDARRDLPAQLAEEPLDEGAG